LRLSYVAYRRISDMKVVLASVYATQSLRKRSAR
jgi:hypothetical protein